mgnify:CR=1 FL=1
MLFALDSTSPIKSAPLLLFSITNAVEFLFSLIVVGDNLSLDGEAPPNKPPAKRLAYENLCERLEVELFNYTDDGALLGILGIFSSITDLIFILKL